ncbi:MAG: roadblock/LC7 domain-containing protein [Gemmatimonadetes bacterium]|nr:roadblock/LC7 domain-containing protein [Gemmatimonadota bacterium]
MTSGAAGSWSFSEADVAEIERRLSTVLKEANARGAFLVDRTGQLITTVGEAKELDSMALASLASANFSANDQLAALVGEKDFSSLVHQGERTSLYLADVERRVILAVLFDQRTTLGLVRLKVPATVQAVARIFQEMYAREEAGARRLRMEVDWVSEAETEIERLFGE